MSINTVPGIYKAKAIDTTGECRVYLLSMDGQPANNELCREVIKVLSESRPQGIAVSVYPAVIKYVSISAKAKVKAGYQLLNVQSLLKAHIENIINPKSWIWGRKVSISEIFALIEETQGIDYVEELLLPVENIKLEPYELAKIKEVTLYAV